MKEVTTENCGVAENVFSMTEEMKILSANGVFLDHTPSQRMYDAIVKSMHDYKNGMDINQIR